MIEHIHEFERTTADGTGSELDVDMRDIVEKLNEVIDAVNALRDPAEKPGDPA